MENFKIDNRNKNDLLEVIKEYAASYTPEWKFDVADPDAISVIGLIYANHTLNNIKNINQLFTKYHIEFANMYGVSLKAATPSKTICVFGINENIFSGSELKKGTQMVGTNDEGDEIIYALSHDICVTTSRLVEKMVVSGTHKYLNSYTEGNIPLFDYTRGNTYSQAIEMVFDILPKLNNNTLYLKFDADAPSRALAEIFGSKDGYNFRYIYMGEEYEFDSVKTDGELIELSAQIGNNEKEERGIVIILEQKSQATEEFKLSGVKLFIKGGEGKPRFLWNGKNEIVDDMFMPFSNQPVLYNELYIGDDFLFEQYSARAILHFKLEFDTYKAAENAVYEEDLRIIKRKKKASYVRAHYISSVMEVSVDYFNGKGWKHLDTDKDMTVIFANENNAGTYDIGFKIPWDWQSVVVGGYEGNCIRIQVIKADNCYINDVEYLYPIISELRIELENQVRGISPSKLTYVHGDIREDDISKAFGAMEYDGDYMFLGFDKRFVNGPISIFADMEKSNSYNGLELEFSYSSSKGFKPLKVIDDTHMFQNSGLLMFMPPIDMNEQTVEGKKGYWIRIEDKNRYFERNRISHPVLKNMYVNAAYAQNMIVNDEQDYYIDVVTSYMHFPLYAQNILTADIWVNEKDQLSNQEMDEILKDEEMQTRIIYNFLGEIEEFYVLWKEVEDFDDTLGLKRCYCIDRNRNEVIFGDGATTYVPQNTIGVAFKAQVVCCDGERANIAAGSIDRFRSLMFSVEDVSNPIGAYGGTNIEDINDALVRGSNILSSRKRLVSQNDYIRETLLFSDTIEQVACITNEKSGISLVLLMKDYKNGDYSFRNIEGRLKEHLLENCEMTFGISDIHIASPIFVAISVDVWIRVLDMANSLEIKQQWLDKITNYLEPIKGKDSNGWQIGKLPTSKQIKLMLGTLEGTAVMENINIMASYTEDGKNYEVNIERIDKNPFMVVCNGNHNIYINGI
jgi:hypothetical protein